MIQFFLASLLLFVSLQGFAQNDLQSWTETHGGDSTAIEALVTISQISMDLRNAAFAAGLKKEFSFQFEQNLRSRLGEVYGADENLSLEGRAKTAINQVSPKDPQRKDILIKNAGWLQLGQNARYRLLLHELLLVAGYDDLDYQASLKLFTYLECVKDQSRIYQENYRLNPDDIVRLGQISSEYVVLYCGSFDGDFRSL